MKNYLKVSKNKEKKLSQVGLLVAKSVYENDNEFRCTDISIDELRSLEKKFDFSVWVKAYLHCLSSDPNYDKSMSLSHAIATVTLSGLRPNGRSRSEVIELLDVLEIDNASEFLDTYEELHDVYWSSAVENNE